MLEKKVNVLKRYYIALKLYSVTIIFRNVLSLLMNITEFCIWHSPISNFESSSNLVCRREVIVSEEGTIGNNSSNLVCRREFIVSEEGTIGTCSNN